MNHISNIQQAAHRPHQIDALLTFADCYKSQVDEKHLEKDLLFAIDLIQSLLKRLGLDLQPVVLFSDGFFTYDAGDTCIFTIPYSFYDSYVRWVNLAHEVGHLYIRRKCGKLIVHSHEEDSNSPTRQTSRDD